MEITEALKGGGGGTGEEAAETASKMAELLKYARPRRARRG